VKDDKLYVSWGSCMPIEFDSKKRRMPIIGVIGLFVLLHAAVFLGQSASSGLFDTSFYLVQCLELAAGAVNLTLMIMNLRDGLRITGRQGQD